MFKLVSLHSLFWKIFFAFWIALLLIVLITALLTNYFIKFEDKRPLSISILEKHAERAVNIYTKKGEIELNNYFNEVQDSHGANEFLFDSNYNEVTGKPYSRKIKRVLDSFQNTSDEYTFIPGPTLTGGLKYQTAEGDTYIFISQIAGRPAFLRDKGMRPGKFGRHHPPNPRRELLPLLLLVSFCVTGLISYILTSYLVNPIQRVRSATKKLSEGDLSFRVSSSLNQRKDELGALAKDFDQMASKLESLMSSQQRMLRDVSHELRTPLARLQVALELARTKSKDIAKDEHDRIEYETQRLNNLIGQILELVRLEHKESTLTLNRTNVTEIIKIIVEDANFEASKKNKGVKLAKSDNYYLDINSELLSSAIENIVRNAITYTPEKTNVQISLKKDTNNDNNLKITIRDFGPGVPSESLEHLFEPFYKIRSRNNVDSSGYGIGLTITQRAVQLHKGKIHAKNDVDKGLIIAIELPNIKGIE